MKTEVCGISFIMCDAYIDQNHRIGDEYVGYKCARLATVKKDGYDACDVCAAILDEAPNRVSWVARGEGKI